MMVFALAMITGDAFDLYLKFFNGVLWQPRNGMIHQLVERETIVKDAN